MNELAWIDGKWMPLKKATVPISDRGLLLGDGIFESMRGDNQHIFALEDHIERLFKGLKTLKIHPNYNKKQLFELVMTGLKKSELEKAYIRIMVSRVDGFGLLPKSHNYRIMIIIKKLEDKKFENGINVIISKIKRPSLKTGLADIKSLNYLSSILAKLDAEEKNADDAILLNEDNYVIEATTSNIFFIKGNTVYYPSINLGILEGITMKHIIKICKNIGLTTSDISIKKQDLINFDEVFLTNSIRGITSIKKIDELEFDSDFNVADNIRNEFTKHLKKH